MRRLSLTVALAIFLSPGTASGHVATPTAHYAFVERPASVRVAPNDHARTIAHLTTVTADGTSMLVEPFAMRPGWVKIHFPVLPNDLVGWVPSRDLSAPRPVYTQLVINTERLRLTLFVKGRPAFSASIGVGKSSTPTPHGSFYVLDRLNVSAGAYAPVAFGTSARSSVLTEWPGGGVIGIHGDLGEPELIPGRPSHGCVRLRDADIARLGRLLPVGTPITIR